MSDFDWNDAAATWDQREDVSAYADLAWAALLEHAPLGALPISRALDFGCGTGNLTTRLAQRAQQVVAIDLAPKMVEVLQAKLDAQGLTHVEALAGDIDAPSPTAPPIEGPFDLIVASSVCAFVPDFRATLARLAGLLGPGGLFVQWDWLPTAEHPDFGFRPADLERAYQDAGLETLRAAPGFEMTTQRGTATVVMGVARRPWPA